jgi:CRISPR-associated endonuclease/helicase Cas3
MYNTDYFNKLIRNSENYFAHLPKENDNKKPELLSEHSSLTYQYARVISDNYHLDEVITNLIKSTIPNILSNRELLASKIEDLFWRAIAFHDLGKVNQNYQKCKMKNKNIDIINVKHNFDSQHSAISVYIFLAFYYNELLSTNLTDQDFSFLDNIALYLSYSIYQHHSSFLDNAQEENIWNDPRLSDLSGYLQIFGINIEKIDDFHKYFFNHDLFGLNGIFGQFSNLIDNSDLFPLFALIKLNYSLLTAADYLATTHYMENWKTISTDFGIIDENLKNRIITSIETSKIYNKEVYEAINKNEIHNPDEYKEQSNSNLNVLRKCLAIEVIKNIRDNYDKNLFYIEAPTGSGKTNLSMLLISELLRNDKVNKISKIFYVFPFTTLITQTYASIIETFNLNDNEIVEVHSKTSMKTNNDEDDYKNYIDFLFLNYPIILLSHIHFFDILKSNSKDSNYLLHQISNSIVIIDEIQSYPPNTWDKIVYFMVNYAKYFNIKFVVMSATLPKIGEILDNKELAFDFVYLVKDKNKYFQNPNFCNRVKFDYDLLSLNVTNKNEKQEYLLNLKQRIIAKSVDYADSNFLYPNSVFTIVEFIFKKTAGEFYNLIKQDNDFYDNIFLLSGTILEPRRKEVINNLKSDEIRHKKILLITTQVVEAGVDIDMDIGFKDTSLIDSDEQLAGRVNRNVQKTGCKLFIFDCDPEKTLYKNDERFKIMKDLKNDYQTILESKNFDYLYNLVIKKIKEKNSSNFISNLSDLIKKISSLDFKGVDSELQIINTQNISVFVPLEIEKKYFKNYENVLKEFNIFNNSETINGANIWTCYENLIKNQNEDFVKNRVKMKKLQGLMLNFIFSIFKYSKDYENLKTYGEEKYGFLYLENYADVYSFENGINTDVLMESNFI